MAFKSAKIVFLATMTFLQADIQCQNNEWIDLVSSNGKKWMECVPPSVSVNFKPSSQTYMPSIHPTVYHKDNKVLYIFDLSKNGKFLNAAKYDLLQIDGNYTGCKVALADRNYFQKEDNYPLILKDGKSNLSALFSHLDLRLLKYLVMIAPKHQNIKINSIKFSKRASVNKTQLPLSTWIWNPQKTHFPHRIERFYIQIRHGFKELTQNILYANSNNEVFGLDGSPDNILDFKQLEEDIVYLSELKKRGISIEGFQIDVEPYLLPNFKKNETIYYLKYLNMIQKLSHLAHEKNLKFSIVIPFWFDAVYINQRSLAYQVVDLADETVLMSYRSNPKEVIVISEDILSYAQAKEKKVRIGMEMKKIEDEEHRLYRQDKKLPCISNHLFQKSCTPLVFVRSYQVKGSSISFYKQYEKAKELLKTQIPYHSFSGFVIHDSEAVDVLF
ncbi:hypothetical protein MNB_SV-3-1581 [hydrothermal vent metagenome]|uniref:Uncharacterized protein n=1 Tax=hydrothermal vent metagenome TaxID=652676 RepID=A0A1W1C9W2_9ZZZZ